MRLLLSRPWAFYRLTGVLIAFVAWPLAAAPASEPAAVRPRLNLTGTWQFAADVGDARLGDVKKPLARIKVPGAWQAQGFGKPGGAIPMAKDESPAAYLRNNLTARCLYVRNVVVPENWRGKRVWLVVRRVYQYADVELNGSRMGEHEGFATPFEMDVTAAVRFGQENQIVLGVDNRPRDGRNLRGSGNYACNWGGIGGATARRLLAEGACVAITDRPTAHHGRLRPPRK